MKLGPFLRKKYTALHELIRKLSVIIDYSLWLIIDPSKYKIIKTKEIDKILVVLINDGVGNVGGDFCILGVINYLKEKYPKIGVSILGDKSTLKRFGRIPGIEMIEYKGKQTFKGLEKKKFKAGIFINLGQLESKDFLFIPYRVAPFYASVGGLLSSKYRLYFTRKAFIPWGTHMVEIGFKMLKSLGFDFKKKDVKFYYSANEKKNVEKFLKYNKIKKFIIIHPGGKYVVETLKKGKWPPHLWPLERYAKVGDFFSKKGYSILVTGSSKEEYLAKKISKLSKKEIINCCGKFTIRELGALLDKSNLLISTDTSIVHIAYEVKVPIVELMGPSYPEVVGAWPINSKRHKILFDDGPCARSMKKIECPEDIICMDNISVEDVIKYGERLVR